MPNMKTAMFAKTTAFLLAIVIAFVSGALRPILKSGEEPLSTLTLQSQPPPEPNLANIPVAYREFDANEIASVASSYANRRVHFEQKAMAVFQNYTEMIGDFLMPKDAYPKGVLRIENGQIEPNRLKYTWRPILGHYYVLALLVTIVFAFGVLMPVFGFCFYCFRCCCGKCGARTQPFDKKYDACRKFFYALTLIVLGTLLLYGIVTMAICIFYLNESVEQVPVNLNSSAEEAEAYHTRTKYEIDFLLVKNYEDLQQNLFNFLNNCNDFISEKLQEYSDSDSLKFLIQIVNNLPKVRDNLLRINDATNYLRANATKSAILLNNFKKELLQELQNCPPCSPLSEEINRLQLTIDYDIQSDRYYPRIKNVTIPLKNIARVLNESIVDEINKGHRNFEELKNTIASEINSEKETVEQAIRESGKEIARFSHQISAQIDESARKLRLTNLSFQARNDFFFESWTTYLMIVVALWSLLCFIFVCVALGLMCGICGKRPDGVVDECCSKGTGSTFLLCGVSASFIFASVLSLEIILLILISTFSKRLVCNPLREPDNSLLIRDLNKLANQRLRTSAATTTTTTPIDFARTIHDCHQNRSAYRAFNLETVLPARYRIDQLHTVLDQFAIRERIEELTAKIHFDQKIVLITRDGKRKLLELAESELADFPFYQYIDELSANMSSFNFASISQKLSDLKQYFPDEFIEDKVYRLEHLNENMNVMKQICDEIKNMSLEVEHDLKLNFTSLRDAIQQLLKRTEESQRYLDENARNLIQKLASEFGEIFVNKIRKYFDRIIDKTNNSIGNCAPLSNIYNSTLTSFCDNILSSINGVWITTLFCVLLFIPIIYVSVKLSTLYQKIEPYPGSLYQADSPYDNYGNGGGGHDTRIPMVIANRKRKNHRKKSETNSSSNYTDETCDESAMVAEAEQSRARSRSQMPNVSANPKHRWEEFASAPPVYNQTEYERPPPYYYPGPAK